MTTPSDPTPERGATPPPPGYAAPPPGYAAPLSDSDQRMWAMLAHIGGIILGFVAPLIIWLVYRERSQLVEDQAKESLNFQITATIAGVVIFVLTLITLGLASPLFLVLWIGILVFCILGGLAANKGQAYRYPFALRLVK